MQMEASYRLATLKSVLSIFGRGGADGGPEPVSIIALT